MCVSHVTLAFTRLYIPNGPLKLRKKHHTAAHKTPCRGTTLGRRAWSAYRSFNSLLFRSQLTKTIRDPSAPPRTRPSRKSCATALSCVEPRREPRSEKASVKNKSYRWCHLFAKSIFCPYTRIASTASCLSTPRAAQERVAGRTRVLNGEENRLSV